MCSVMSIIKSDLRSHNLKLYSIHKYFKPRSHLNQFEMKTQTIKLTWFIPN
jgi:hypothetical protein